MWSYVCLAMLLALTVSHAADEDSACCSAEDKKDIRLFWPLLYDSQHLDHTIKIGQLIFQNLFTEHPEYKALLKDVHSDDLNSPEFKAHTLRVAKGLDIAIGLLDDSKTLAAYLKTINAQYLERPGFTATALKDMYDEILDVMKGITGCHNQNAWKRCLGKLTQAIGDKLPK